MFVKRLTMCFTGLVVSIRKAIRRYFWNSTELQLRGISNIPPLLQQTPATWLCRTTSLRFGSNTDISRMECVVLVDYFSPFNVHIYNWLHTPGSMVLIVLSKAHLDPWVVRGELRENRTVKREPERDIWYWCIEITSQANDVRFLSSN